MRARQARRRGNGFVRLTIPVAIYKRCGAAARGEFAARVRFVFRTTVSSPANTQEIVAYLMVPYNVFNLVLSNPFYAVEMCPLVIYGFELFVEKLAITVLSREFL
jgi:hypothetical protein